MLGMLGARTLPRGARVRSAVAIACAALPDRMPRNCPRGRFVPLHQRCPPRELWLTCSHSTACDVSRCWTRGGPHDWPLRARARAKALEPTPPPPISCACHCPPPTPPLTTMQGQYSRKGARHADGTDPQSGGPDQPRISWPGCATNALPIVEQSSSPLAVNRQQGVSCGLRARGLEASLFNRSVGSAHQLSPLAAVTGTAKLRALEGCIFRPQLLT
jgi:hypothetical protein